jgi:diguanylate cyclase (GGDEF)-like protein
LIVSASVWFAVSHRENQQAALDLTLRANGHALALQSGINSYLRKLSGLRALFEASDHVSREQFNVFSKRIVDDQNAILGMSWIPRVTRDQRITHERMAALDGSRGYRIKSVAPDGSMAPSPEKGEYFPVLYTATEILDSPVYGLDLNDGGIRQETLEHARHNDAIATSPLFTLQSGTGHRRGFFVALPVYAVRLPHDGLTDLANRHLFNEEMANSFKQLARRQKLALLCLDLDRFKNVNDTLGHPVGDKLLQQGAARLRLCIRECDTLACLGGDEFAILQRGVVKPAEAKSLSERIVEAIDRPFDLDGQHVVIG